MKRTYCYTLLAAALVVGPPPLAGASDGKIAIEIEANQSGPKIDREIFSQFTEHLGTGIYGGVWVGKDSKIPNVRGIRSDVVGALKAIKVPVVRWPGGCFADEYHWRDGIGPAGKRRATLNASWGGVIEPDSFGTDEFFDFIDQVGAEAFISVNIGSGTVQEAADWLEYMTAAKPTTLAKLRAANGHPAPYRVKYLGLGNENWGCGGAMSPEHYVEEMKRFSHYSRNLSAPEKGPDAMKRIVVGYGDPKSDYTEAVMKAWHDPVWSWSFDAVSVHNYTLGSSWPPKLPSTNFGEDDYAKLLKQTLEMDGLIAQEAAIMDRYDPDKKVGVAVDEWGAWLTPTPGTNPGFLQQQNTLRDGILAALNINIFARHADRVHMSCIAQMANVLQSMFLTDGPKMVLTPTYYVYKMYVPFQEATFVPVKFDAGSYEHAGISMPRIDATAARDTSGHLWLAATNIDPTQAVTIVIDVAGTDTRSASGQVLSGAAVDSMNTFDAPNTVVPKAIEAVTRDGKLELTLPPKSVAVLAVR